MRGRKPYVRKLLQPQPSALAERFWDVEQVGRVSCIRPTGTHLERADLVWVPNRPAGDVHDWRWAKVMVNRHDDHVVLSDKGEPLGLWCSCAEDLLTLHRGRYYRVDFIEIHPQYRGGELGLFLMAMIASRALECEANGLVLNAIKEARGLYDRTGGVQQLAAGWNAAQDLLPYEYTREALLELEELGEAYREEANDGSEDESEAT